MIGLISTTGSLIQAIRGDRPWGWWEIGSVVMVPILLALGYVTVSSLITARPELIVDRTGLTMDKQYLAWNEMTAIKRTDGLRHLTPWAITVVPRDKPRRRSLGIPPYNISAPDMVADWLTSLLDQHRATESSTPSQDEPGS
ncbi:hypothetical protein [Kribbella caucasensis]|uniref:hypothetical protein n=1 Tax=Kribbella caucasensis TaxID=2512215 RepID=UPI001060A662|nr:hypothetical protein [Kribbella sp. VKM Ac-2527]